MGGLIDLEWNGCEPIEHWTHYGTFNFDFIHDIDVLDIQVNILK